MAVLPGEAKHLWAQGKFKEVAFALRVLLELIQVPPLVDTCQPALDATKAFVVAEAMTLRAEIQASSLLVLKVSVGALL